MHDSSAIALPTPVPHQRPWGSVRSLTDSMSDSKLMHEDPHWLAGYRRGDAEALQRVFETHSEELKRLLLTGLVTKSEGKRVRIRIQDPDERDEILNEVFARAFFGRHS